MCLTPDEVMHRMSVLPYQKMKSRINFSGLSTEEIDELKDDGIGNTKYTQQVYNTAKIFFTVLMHSQDPENLKYTVIVKDASGDVTYFFGILFVMCCRLFCRLILTFFQLSCTLQRSK